MSWMAWTWQTAVFFIFIAALLISMAVWEYLRPGGAPRLGILRLHTTRGDRLFISLLGGAYIHMLWIMLALAHIAWAIPISFLWAYFVFRRV